VRIPIELSIRYRPLVVKVVLTGEYAPGHRITEISVDPSSVTVFGAPGIVAALPGFIETEPIDLEGAQADVVAYPSLNVPPNVSVIMDEQPVVTVSIEPIQSSQTVVITPEIQGLDPGFTCTVSPATVEVILSGPLPLLEALETDDARVVLDLFDLPVGTHQIEPQIVVPEGVTAQSVNPATVQVEILAAPTPTPGRSEQ
jgi:YbbR domain-containing protein